MAAANPPDPTANCSERVTVARVVRPRGRRGEVAAEILTDFPERLTHLREAYLWNGSGAPRLARLVSCWLHQGRAIFHFQGCNSIDDAELLRGLQVQVPLAQRAALPPAHYYISDLVGCEVWEGGAKLGTVRDVQSIGEETRGTPILVIEGAPGELLVPLAEEICTAVDLAVRRIEVVLPEGLLELNRKGR